MQKVGTVYLSLLCVVSLFNIIFFASISKIVSCATFFSSSFWSFLLTHLYILLSEEMKWTTSHIWHFEIWNCAVYSFSQYCFLPVQGIKSNWVLYVKLWLKDLNWIADWKIDISPWNCNNTKLVHKHIQLKKMKWKYSQKSVLPIHDSEYCW